MLIVSDFHLGCKVCQADKIIKVLTEIPFETLIINGDLFDSFHLHRLKSSHWKVLSLIRKISKTHKVIYNFGNHCSELGENGLDVISSILGIRATDEYQFEVNGISFLATHGHKTDEWINKRQFSTWFFGGIYYLIQLFNQKLAKFIKIKSKEWLKIDAKMKRACFEFGLKNKIDVIINGHSHMACIEEKDGVKYCNSGSFCDSVCHYLTINELGEIQLHEI